MPKIDNHFWATIVFAAIVVLNHKLGLQLTLSELAILGVALGVAHVVQAFGLVAKLRGTKEEPPKGE